MLDAMIAQLITIQQGIKQNLKDQQALGHHSGTIKTVAAVAPHHPTEEDHMGLGRLIRLLCYSCVHIPCHSWHVERYQLPHSSFSCLVSQSNPDPGLVWKKEVDSIPVDHHHHHHCRMPKSTGQQKSSKIGGPATLRRSHSDRTGVPGEDVPCPTPARRKCARHPSVEHLDDRLPAAQRPSWKWREIQSRKTSEHSDGNKNEWNPGWGIFFRKSKRICCLGMAIQTTLSEKQGSTNRHVLINQVWGNLQSWTSPKPCVFVRAWTKFGWYCGPPIFGESPHAKTDITNINWRFCRVGLVPLVGCKMEKNRNHQWYICHLLHPDLMEKSPSRLLAKQSDFDGNMGKPNLNKFEPYQSETCWNHPLNPQGASTALCHAKPGPLSRSAPEG